MGVEVTVLGPVVVRRDGEPVELGGPKQRAVLAVLLAAAPDAVSHAELIEEVWGDAGPADPLRSLQVHVSALRKAIGSPSAIVATPAGYRSTLAPGDAALAEDELRRAAALVRDGSPEEALTVAETALSRWHGPAWQDARHLPGPAARAQRLDRLRVDLEELRARALVAAGRHRDALGPLEHLVAAHPLHEGLLELRLLALHRSGRRSEALEEYAAAARRLRDETGLDPGESLQRLHAALLADDPGLVVEDADLRGRRHLPAPLTALVGREEDAAALAEALATHRLVTLTGPGGVGKTRLALQAGHEAAAGFPDGVWFVDLQAVTDPGTVPEAIADAVGLAAPDDIGQALRQWVRDRRALLVLDNFEQVDAAAPVVTHLLAAGDGLRVLVTSRSRLRVYGEHVHPLQPLEPVEARQLFAERARSVSPRFAADASVLDQVCGALDGLPLAIELVAARADELGAEEMLAGLDRRLSLAAEGPRDRAPRQRSLRAAVLWSVDLLAPPEAEAFGRLAVFAGGFTTEAVAQVVGPAATAALTPLARASLLVRDGDRWRMLETIRECALEHAGESLTPVRARHAAWCRELAEAGVAGMVSDRRTWLPRLRAEMGNLRSALEHLGRDARSEQTAGADRTNSTASVQLLSLAADLAPYWYRAAPGSEDVQWLSRALALAPDAPPVLRARAWYGLAVCAAEQGETEQAIEHGRQALDLLPPGLDDAWRARALNTVAGLTRDLGRAEESLALMEESLALRRAVADPQLTLLIPLLNLALSATDLSGRGPAATARAREALAEAMEVARDDGERAVARGRLVGVALAEGAVDEAAALLAEVVPVLRAEDEHYRLIESLEQLAALAALRGAAYECAVLLAATDRAMAEDGARLVPADRTLRERRTAAALDSLPTQARADARAEGEALDLDAALDRGLAGPALSGPGAAG